MTNKEAIEELKAKVNLAKELEDEEVNFISIEVLDLAIKALEERPQGEWIVKSSGTTHYFMCNTCGSAGDIQDKYCRECGLKMKAREEND